MRKSASQDSTEMKQTIVLNDSEIEGDIILPGDLCLFGKISGNVTAKGKVEVGSRGNRKYFLCGARGRGIGGRERGNLFFDY